MTTQERKKCLKCGAIILAPPIYNPPEGLTCDVCLPNEQVADYDHEDAFKAANLCAANRTNLGGLLKSIKSKEEAETIIKASQTLYKMYFDIFMEGVTYGRENPVEKKEMNIEKKIIKAQKDEGE